MNRLLSIIKKEFILLIRDIPGLLTLFIMPFLLIIVVTLAQQKAFDSFKGSGVTVLLIDNDRDSVSYTFAKQLRQNDMFTIKMAGGNEPIGLEEARSMVAGGTCQAGIIIPEKTTSLLTEKARNVAGNSMHDSVNDPMPEIIILLDPAINSGYKSALSSAVKNILMGIESRRIMEESRKLSEAALQKKFTAVLDRALARQTQAVEKEMNTELQSRLGSFAPAHIKLDTSKIKGQRQLPGDMLPSPISTDLLAGNELLKVTEEFAGSEKLSYTPNLVQNNVPAFTLFAMFFIVIPLSGSLIFERSEGTYARLKTLPVGYMQFVFGKIVVYLLICMLQFLLMVFTGMHVLPAFFDVPALQTGSHLFAIALAAIFSALGAIGFGLLISVFTKSFSQAAMFGSLSVVILSLISGIFLPVYLLPEALAKISLFSPVRWGIDSFLDLFLRNGGVVSILPELIFLFMFFLASLSITYIHLQIKKQ